MRPHAQKDVTSAASSIPLPSSPIAIPTPAPKLKLDFGTPELLSPFACITHTALAEIRVLQDPRNITTGCPSSGPVTWRLENKSPPPRESVVPGPLSANVESKYASTEPESFMLGPTLGTEDHFSQKLSPITLPGLSLQSETDTPKRRSPQRYLSSGLGRMKYASTQTDVGASPLHAKLQDSHDEAPFALGLRNPDSIEDFAGVSMQAMSDVNTTPAKSLMSHIEEPNALGSERSSPVELLELPPPLFCLEVRSSERSNDNTDCASRDKSNVDDDTASGMEHMKDVACTHRPSVAPLASELTSLIADAAQKSGEDTSINLAAPKGVREDGCNARTERSPKSSHEEGDTPWSLEPAIDFTSLRAVEDSPKTDERAYPRKDSLFDGSTAGDIPQHGLPSPTRKVKLPLRLKNEVTKHTSFESLVFKPNLDRVAAKELGVFQPSSDPSLRERYFPHLPVSPSSLVRHACQSSLDSGDGGIPTTQNSSEHSGIFERAVETPSPLQIRKQPGFIVTHFTSSPGTPREGPVPALAPSSSSPTRTPTMGDRQLFDLQRAERNVRYNAIHSGGDGHARTEGDSDLRLADSDNAGPGSRGSSPKRKDSEEEAVDTKAAELLLEQALADLATTSTGPVARSVHGRLMFALSRN